tara:strand:+ start:1561 stop:4059 length:2499 start_codon:yes stop_codon:yes gene_type:complete
MGVLDSGSRDFLKRTNLYSGSEPGVAGPETGFMENFTASAANFAYHFKSTSESETMNDLMNHQLDLIYAHNNPDFRFNPKHKDGLNIKRDLSTKEKLMLGASSALMPQIGMNLAKDGINMLDFGYDQKKKQFQDKTNEILAIQAKNPNTKIRTWDQIMDDARDESQRLKEVLSQVSNTRTWSGVAGNLTGVMKEAITDPFVIASMGLGWSKITGGTKSLNAAKAFMTEFLIGAGSETIIQPFVMDWQAKLESPWSLKDAAVTILTVGGFAGVTRAAGSYVVDVAEAAKASKILRSQGETVKADTLDNFIDLFNGAPKARDVLDQDLQLKAIDDFQKALDEGRTSEDLTAIISDEVIKDVVKNANFNQGKKTGVNIPDGVLNTINTEYGSVAVERYIKEVFEVAKRNLNNSKKSQNDIARMTKTLDEQLVRNLEDVRKRITKVDEVIKPNEVIRLSDLDGPETVAANANFREPGRKLNLNIDEYHRSAIPLQKELEEVGRFIQDELKEAVGFITPGIKSLEKLTEKITRKGYANTGNLTDVVRIGFLTKEYSNAATVIERLSKKFEILDEGLVTTPAGYRDHKLLVRFKDGQIGEIQIWEPHVLAAKEGKGFVRNNFPKYMKDFVSDMDVPTRANSGHAIYDRSKKLIKDGVVAPKNKKKFKELTKRQVKLYSEARRLSNISWNSVLDKSVPLSKTSAGEAGSQAPGSASSGTKNPRIDPSEGSATTAGLPSQSTKLDTSSQLNINSTSKPIIPDTERILLGDPELKRIMDEEIIEAQRIIDEAGGEMDIPFTLIDDLGNEVTVVQGVKKVFNDIENDEKALASLNKCMGRAA